MYRQTTYVVFITIAFIFATLPSIANAANCIISVYNLRGVDPATMNDYRSECRYTAISKFGAVSGAVITSFQVEKHFIDWCPDVEPPHIDDDYTDYCVAISFDL